MSTKDFSGYLQITGMTIEIVSNKTILSCQWEWRDKVFNVKIVVQHDGSCRAKTCGVTT